LDIVLTDPLAVEPSGKVAWMVEAPGADAENTPLDAPIVPPLPDVTVHVAFCGTPPKSTAHWLVCPTDTETGVQTTTGAPPPLPHAALQDAAPDPDASI
jgi:hypothetical protein